MFRAGAVIGLVIASWLTVMPTRAAAQTAEGVFEKLSASVVRVNDLEGHGSGVVVSETGLVLTNYHVVSAGLDLSVTMQVFKDGHTRVWTFPGVEVVGVHPDYDLALLQVDLRGAKPIPAKRAERGVRTGQVCYVIGNPGGGEHVLDNSISDGIVSAASRKLDGQVYVQTDAAINPGNSGGPLANDAGEVLGIVTFKLDQAEGIGFAIPIGAFDRKAMIPPHRLKPDAAAARAIAQRADRLIEEAKRTRDTHRRDTLTSLAIAGYRLALSQDPRNPELLYNVGVGYLNRGQAKVGAAFLQRVVDVAPNNSLPYHLLGLEAARLGKLEEAEAHWTKGLAIVDEHAAQRAGCAEQLATVRVDQERWAEAAYLAAWAIRLDDQPDRRPQRRRILADAGSRLTVAQLAHLRTDPLFSMGGMKQFAGLKRGADEEPPVRPETKPAGPATGGPMSPGLARAARYQRVAKLTQAPTPVTRAGLQQKLAGVPIDLQPAYSGLYLAVRYQEPNRIDLFNLHDGRRALKIDLKEPGAVFACGGDSLFIFYNKLQVLETWDLRTLKLADSKRLVIANQATILAMGMENPDLALIGTTESTDSLARRWFDLVDMKRATTLISDKKKQWITPVTSYRDHPQIRTNLDLTYAAMWRQDSSQQGYVRLKIADGGFTAAPGPSGHGTVGMSAKTMAFTSMGWVVDFEGADIRVQREGRFFPVIDAEAYYVQLVVDENKKKPDRLRVMRTLGNREAHAFDLPRNLPRKHELRGFAYDRLIVAVARVDRLVVTDPDIQRMTLYPLGLPDDAAETVADAAGATPGKPWSRQIRLPDDAEVELIDGPAGLELDAAKRTLSWSVPASAKLGTVEVLLLVKLPDGSASYDRQEIKVGP